MRRGKTRTLDGMPIPRLGSGRVGRASRARAQAHHRCRTDGQGRAAAFEPL